MNARLRKLLPAIAAGLLVAFSFSACETPGQTALAGAATGAAVGGLLHGRGSDALAGAAIGAGAGYLIGKVAEHRRGGPYYEDGYYHETRYRHSRYPVGRPTDRRYIVESPYPPYNLIDTRGIPSGAEVIDPSVRRVFVNP